MPYKDINKRRGYRRKWYALNKLSERKHVYRRRKEIRKWYYNYKHGLKCSICGESHPATLDFHHRDKSEKESNINFIAHDGHSIESIKQELSKCEVLCANCHRKLHYENSNI